MPPHDHFKLFRCFELIADAPDCLDLPLFFAVQLFAETLDMDIYRAAVAIKIKFPDLSKELFARVRAGDPDCTEVFRESAEKLATILAFSIDILNPEVIALGGIFMRNADLFMPIINSILDEEALDLSRKVCRIVPAELGENIGDYAALAVALDVEKR